MKIAYVVDGRMPSEKANGYQSAQMCQAFIEEGHELELIVPSRKEIYVEGIERNTTLKEYYGLRKDIIKKKVFSFDFIYLLQVMMNFSDNNPIAKIGSLLSSWSTALGTVLHLIRKSYDMIYVRSNHVLIALITLLPQKVYSKMFFEVHSIPQNRKNKKRLISALKKIGGLVTITEQLKKQLVENGLSDSKILVAHDGVDIDTFNMEMGIAEARERLNIPVEKKIAAYVGKFHTNGNEKGIPEIIKSAKYLLLEDFPNLDFYFIGGPINRVQFYKDIIKGEKLPEERFIFLDKQPIQKVPLFLKAADVLLMPFPWSEHYAYFMSPLKMFEYMAAKRPIVATKLPSILEILESSKNSILADPGCPKSLADSIKIILNSREFSDKIAIQAYQDVRRYTWRKRAEKILKFIVRNQETINKK